MHPFGFKGIEPRALDREEEGQDAYSGTLLFDLLVMLSDPITDDVGFVPSGIIPNQE